jgi:hypothetical protein
MSSLKVRDIVYLGGEVSALVNRDYLDSKERDATILDLSQTDNGREFCPINPDYFSES